jgi:DNA-binding GntR family transcriptional regulator
MAVQLIGQIKKSTLINEIADVLRESIVTGAIPPDTRLTEQDFSKQLSVSRGSLREALRILESEGLVVDIPRRGFYVVNLSLRDIEEVYSLRLLLELEALKRALKHIKPEHLDVLESILAGMTDAARRGDLFRVVNLDVEFHRNIWKIADHKLLLQTLEGFILKISMYLSVQTHLYEDLNAGISDHFLLLAAIRDQNESEASSILTRHINDALQIVLDYARMN